MHRKDYYSWNIYTSQLFSLSQEYLCICVLHEVEERDCDEMINVSNNVHDDEVETAPFRQVIVLLLDIDLQQFVVMKEEQVVTEK